MVVILHIDWVLDELGRVILEYKSRDMDASVLDLGMPSSENFLAS